MWLFGLINLARKLARRVEKFQKSIHSIPTPAQTFNFELSSSSIGSKVPSRRPQEEGLLRSTWEEAIRAIAATTSSGLYLASVYRGKLLSSWAGTMERSSDPFSADFSFTRARVNDPSKRCATDPRPPPSGHCVVVWLDTREIYFRQI